MRLTRERIVLLGVLGAGVLILAVDKTLLGPSGASAATSEAPVATGSEAMVPPVAGAPPGPGVPEAERVGLADRLESLAGEQAWSEALVAESLAVGEHWRRRAEEGAAPTPTGATPPEDPAAAFAAAHRLTAVVLGDGTAAVAVINGHPRSIGAEIDGFRLVEVDRKRAVLERDGVRVELNVGRPPG